MTSRAEGKVIMMIMMRNRVVLALMVVAALIGVTPAPAATLEEVIAKHVEARGGDKWNAVETMQISGSYTAFSETHPFTVSLMLAIAYACSLGGIATLVGTPPNLSFARIFEISFPNAEPIAFGQWLLMAFPITVVMLTIVWLLLTRVFFRFPASFEVDRDVVRREYAALRGGRPIRHFRLRR